MITVFINTRLGSEHLAELRAGFPGVDFYVGEKLAADPALMGKTEILVTYGWDITAGLVRQMPHLKWIQALRAGVDNFPGKELQKRGIPVTTVRGIHGIPMAEHAMAMILSFSRGLTKFRANQFNRVWQRNISLDEIYDKTLGIAGTGSIGREIAKRARAFGMKTLGINTTGNPVEGVDRVMTPDQLPTLLSESDYLVVTLPLTDKTFHLFGAREFNRMKPTAYFINLARGQIADEAALVRALQEGEIAGAGLDVFESEPLPEDSPLWQMENVIMTPHLAALSPRYTERALGIFMQNLKAFLSGDALVNVMNWQRGY